MHVQDRSRRKEGDVSHGQWAVGCCCSRLVADLRSSRGQPTFATFCNCCLNKCEHVLTCHVPWPMSLSQSIHVFLGVPGLLAARCKSICVQQRSVGIVWWISRWRGFTTWTRSDSACCQVMFLQGGDDIYVTHCFWMRLDINHIIYIFYIYLYIYIYSRLSRSACQCQRIVFKILNVIF